MLEISGIIAPLFIIILASAILQKSGAIGKDWSGVLNDFALKVGLPVLVFTSLAQTSFSFLEQAPLIIINSVFIIVSFLLALLLGKSLRLSDRMIRTLFMCFGFGNIAYLGIPVLVQTSGEEILPIASLIVAMYVFWFFSLGIAYLEYKTHHSKKVILMTTLQHMIRNPILIAVVLGITIGSFGIILPAILLESLNMITASVTPTVLIVIGLFIGKSHRGTIKEWIPVIAFSFVTLILLPALLYYVISLSGLSLDYFGSSIVMAAMPLAITPFALADTYDLNKTFIARSIVLSTILSVLTLPFWINIIQ
jgi:predicted permease